MVGDNRLNCWDYQGCGHGPDCHGVSGSGVCPTYTAVDLDASNGGTNGGRACWVVTGTLCEEQAFGTFEEKFNDCRKCSFYQRVAVEQGLGFEPEAALLSKYRDVVADPG